MSRSLIRKNQLHPDIADLVGEYGSGLFISDEQVVYTSGNQTISGNKNFIANQYVFSGAKVSFFANQYLFSGANVSFVDESNNKNLLVSGNRILVGDTISNQSDGSRLQVQDGITFQSTTPTVTNRNTLDFYEEGAWNPALCLTTDTNPYATNYYTYDQFSTFGTYTRIANLVFVTAQIHVIRTGSNSIVTGAGFGGSGIVIGNLPFEVLNLNNQNRSDFGSFTVPFWNCSGVNTATNITAVGLNGKRFIALYRTTGSVSTPTGFTHSLLRGTTGTGIRFLLGGTYQTPSPSTSLF
jgi:hypothetical protein